MALLIMAASAEDSSHMARTLDMDIYFHYAVFAYKNGVRMNANDLPTYDRTYT